MANSMLPLVLLADSERFPGVDGFLGTRGSIMLDFVFLAMFAIVPVLGLSVWLVRYRRRYELHKRIQVTLGIILLIAVGAFEIDMQMVTKRAGWLARANPSPYYPDGVWRSLYVHLTFAVPTLLLWIYVIVQALRKFPQPPAPCAYSRTHRITARLAAAGMVMTAVTGWIFYWMSFVM